MGMRKKHTCLLSNALHVRARLFEKKSRPHFAATEQVFLVFTDFHTATYTDPFRFPTNNLYLKRKYNLNVNEENIFLKNEKDEE